MLEGYSHKRSVAQFFCVVAGLLFIGKSYFSNLHAPEFSLLTQFSGSYEVAVMRTERNGGIYFRLKGQKPTFFYSQFSGEKQQVINELKGSDSLITVWGKPAYRYDFLFDALQVYEVFQIETAKGWQRSYDEIKDGLDHSKSVPLYIGLFFLILAWKMRWFI